MEQTPPLPTPYSLLPTPVFLERFNMNSLLFLPVTLVLGIFLGNLYFRGLWMMVQKLPTAQNPILLTLGSFFRRLGILIAGFALVLAIAQENAIWHLIVCLGAFIWVRNRIIEKLQQKWSRSLNAH
ncbi:MAG: ATP synthase subunit I [Stigonema ocellatum SAG 48.90 = DSM 106950]|nr:ATP synthase subunit I [Stigonema ocellatum SAG 48.90 = DSM 106950]